MVEKQCFAQMPTTKAIMNQFPIYLDHAATTPVLPHVRDAIGEAMARFANPSSQHAAGRAARAALEEARGRVATKLGWHGEVLFTGGATEALTMAWQRGRGTRKLASAVEHPALTRLVGDAVIAVDGNGLVDPASLPPADLVAVQQVNNETGAIQPLTAIAEVVRATGGLLLADCAQGAGKLALPDADFIVVAGHKLGAPAGIGALLVRELALLEPSGGQERGYRPGTENLPYILGLAAALEAERGWLERARGLRDWLEGELRGLGAQVVAQGAARVPTIGSYRLAGVNASQVLIRCDMAGICISAGSACSSGSLKPSPVMLAMGMCEAEAREVFRVSIGRETTQADLAALVAVIRNISERGRAA